MSLAAPSPFSHMLGVANMMSAILAEKVARQLIKLAPNADPLLRPLEGRSLLLKIDDLDTGYFLLFDKDGIIIKGIQSKLVEQPDVTLHGPLSAFLSAAVNTEFDDLTMRGDIQFAGSVQTARQVEQLFKQLEPDFDEPLAATFGDVAGHQIATAIRGLLNWFGELTTSVNQDLSEYLQYELAVTPGQLQQKDFFAAVSQLRSQSDRLMARIKRLRTHLEASDSNGKTSA